MLGQSSDIRSGGDFCDRLLFALLQKFIAGELELELTRRLAGLEKLR
jgi:hypothetical protein